MASLISCYYLLLPLILPLPILFIILRRKHLTNSPPTPLSLPLIGHLHLVGKSLHLSLTSLSSRYGPIFSLRLGCKPFVVISSPSAVEECFTKNDVVFANRPTSMAGDRLTYNYAAFVWSPYGHFWRTLRKVTTIELFSSHSLTKSAGIREEETRKILSVLLQNRGRRVDLNYLGSVYSFNHVMRAVAGKPLAEEGEIGGEVGEEKLKQIRRNFSISFSQGMCDFFPVLRWIGYRGIEKDLIALHEKRDEFLQNLLAEVKMKNDGTNTNSKKNLIETLLSLQASEPEFYTDDVIKSIILIMYIAGTETTAGTLEWAMSLLLSHPSELLKLRQEIDDNVGHHHLINDSDLAKLPYLRCIVNETLRMYPPVPLLLPHYSSENCTVGGYNIPKGTILLVNAWAMQRDPKLWDKPDEFNPERFLDADVGYKFVPFGTGRRACPGSSMGLRTVALALGAYVQCFEWEKVSGHEEMESKYKLIMLQKKKPLEAVCIPRNEAADILSKL